MSKDARRDEFYRYLDKARIMDIIAKSLIKLYDQKKSLRPTTPEMATPHIMKLLGGVSQEKYDEAVERMKRLEAEVAALQPEEEEEEEEPEY